MGTIVKDGTIVYTHIDDIPRGAMEIRLPVPEGYVAEIISDGLIAIRPVESEGEKIREEIVSFIRAFWVDHRDSVPQASKWLDWLEKQKEQKDYRKLYEDIAKSEWFKKAYEGKSLGCDEEQKEQKPEWNEEDDAHLKRLCRIIHNQVVNKRLSLAEESELGNWMDKWLNHKPQSHWKPSEEQMEALEWMLTTVTMKDGGFGVVLKNLVNDIKKLM